MCQIKCSVFLSILLFNTNKPGKQAVTVVLWYCQLCVINLLLFCIWQRLCLIYMYQAGGCLILFCLVSSRTNSRPTVVPNGPYVSYEAQQAAVVSPQSVGPEASSAPPQCYATRAGPRPGSVGCLAEHSHCTHRRCRWGSEGTKKKKNSQSPPQTLKSAHV